MCQFSVCTKRSMGHIFVVAVGLLFGSWVEAENPSTVTKPMPRSRKVLSAKQQSTSRAVIAQTVPTRSQKAADVRTERAKPQTGMPPISSGHRTSVVMERTRRDPASIAGVTVLENRDARSYVWTLFCDHDAISGKIGADSIVHFRHRGGVRKPCQLALSGQSTKVSVGTGERLMIRQGRLFAVQVTTVVYPPIPTVGDRDLASNPHFHRQWALFAKASSEYTNASWSAMQATGPANVMVCSDSVNAWATKAADQGMEWLSLLFKHKVRAIGVVIYLNLNPGAIVRIEAQTGSGWLTVWEGKDISKGICPAKLALRFGEPVDTHAVRIVLDTRLVSGWNEIDAVELISSP